MSKAQVCSKAGANNGQAREYARVKADHPNRLCHAETAARRTAIETALAGCSTRKSKNAIDGETEQCQGHGNKERDQRAKYGAASETRNQGSSTLIKEDDFPKPLHWRPL